MGGTLNEVRVASQWALNAAQELAFAFPWGGASGNTQRGPSVSVIVSGHTEGVTFRADLGDSAAGPWFLAVEIATAAGVLIDQEVRLPAGPFVRFRLQNDGAAPTTGMWWVQELPEYRVRT